MINARLERDFDEVMLSEAMGATLERDRACNRRNPGREALLCQGTHFQQYALGQLGTPQKIAIKFNSVGLLESGAKLQLPSSDPEQDKVPSAS